MEIPSLYSSDITKTWRKRGKMANKSAAQNDVVA
jgi:hypothetical protein